jgi:hypothetical protein
MTDKEHDDVEMLLEGTPADIMEIISGEPEYYLTLVEKYRKMRDGRDIYLPDLFNIIVERDKSNNRIQRIKFKMGDNEPWNEIGYSDEKYTDADAYAAFSEKVYNLLLHPVSQAQRRAIIQDTTLESGDAGVSDRDFLLEERGLNIGDGNQNVITKIDRFMSRKCQDGAAGASPPLSEIFKSPVGAPPVSSTAPAKKKADLLPTVVAEYKKTLLKKLRTANKRGAMKRAQLIIESTDPHIVSMRNRLPELDAGQRIVMLNYLDGLFTTHVITSKELLASLSAEEQKLVKSYNIDILSLLQQNDDS